MSRLLRNDDIKNINSRKVLQDIMEFRANDTQVVSVYAKECKFNGIPFVKLKDYDVEGQMNVFDIAEINAIRHDNSIPVDISDEAISDCMKENGIVIKMPKDSHIIGVPVCNVAMGSVGDRINLKGNGLYSVEEKKVFEPYSPSEKALIGNMGLQHNKGMMQILIQDETVVTMRSSEYTHLPIKGIVEAYEEIMSHEFAAVNFSRGTIDRQLMILEYELVDDAKQKNLAATLRRLGFDCEEVRTYHRIVTSDVGESSVRIYMMYDLGNGRRIISGEQASLAHNKGASIERFKDKTCRHAISLLFQAEKTIERLAEIQIENPGGCLRNIASKLHLPKEASLIVGANMDAMYVSGCTALDVYCMLYEIIQEREIQLEESFSPFQLLQINEKISKALLMNFEVSDIEFEWR